MRKGIRRVPIAIAVMLGGLLLAGCNENASADPDAPAWPPGASGIACNDLSFDQVEQTLGVRFAVFGGSSRDEVHTCALTTADAEFPDLVLSITGTTTTDTIFQATVAPAGAAVLKDPGRIAYRHAIAAGGKRGPIVEIGWLTNKGRLLFLRYTFPRGADQSAVDALAAKLIDLAKAIDTAVGQPVVAG